jgi:TolB-like protein/DNA-binding winged helix-turn-helix (wHTH) protein/tetratricopeptide (TPR) repeat protein
LFEFDARTGELRRDGHVVKLPPQPARVLALLLSRPGDVILREELRAHLWGRDTFVDFERGLNFCILQVRGALGDSSENPRFVQTVPRQGYRFIAPVAVHSELRPPAHPPPSADHRPFGSLSRRGALIGLAALAVVMLIAWTVGRRGAEVAPVTETMRAMDRPAARIRVAVLPFVNLTGDAATDYLADGLTDEVISQLGQLGPDRLAVIARTSAMSYRNTSKSVADIGRELNATFVVESSIRREGNALRIASSLVPTGDQSPTAVWTETFGSQAGAPDSQVGAAIRVARLIALELLDGNPTAEPPRATANVAAWDALMRGHALMNRGTPDDVRRAIIAFESAVRDDSALAAAWARIAEAQHLLVMMGAVAPMQAYPAAQEAAARALAADAALPDAHVAQGLVDLWYLRQPARAAASFERALALNASHAAALHDYAWTLVALGRDAEAVSRITAARDLDPLSARANNDIGWLYLQLRQPADAMRACQHTLAIHEDSLEAQACLERAYVQRGMYDAALRSAHATMPGDAPPAAASSSATEAEAALRGLWRRRLERLERAAATRWVSPYTLATSLAMLGETDRALGQLEAAVDERVGMLAFLSRDPALDPLRGDPRFQKIVTRLNETSR